MANLHGLRLTRVHGLPTLRPLHSLRLLLHPLLLLLLLLPSLLFLPLTLMVLRSAVTMVWHWRELLVTWLVILPLTQRNPGWTLRPAPTRHGAWSNLPRLALH